jgi:hypothetical protein
MESFHLYKIKVDKESAYIIIYVIDVLKDNAAFNALIVRSDIPYLIIPIYTEAFYKIVDLGYPSLADLKRINVNFLCTVKLATILSGYVLESTRNEIGDYIRDKITQQCLCDCSEDVMRYAAMTAMSLCRTKNRSNLESYVQSRLPISENT